MEKFTCPVCGYPCLTEAAYNEYGEGSYEICSCCGFEFGLDDYLDKSNGINLWRRHWIDSGYPWFSKYNLPPDGWNGKEQLETLIGQENN